LFGARAVTISKTAQYAAITRFWLQDSAAGAATIEMLSSFFGINNLRSLAMRASNNGLRMVDSLVHDEILNYEYFSTVSM